MLGIVIIVVLALVVAWVALSNSTVLRIEKIEAVGVEHLTADEIEQLAAVPDDATLLNVDSAAIQQNLMQDAWIESVEINRIPPNTLRLKINERAIAAVVKVPSANAKTTRRWAISADGIWLMPIPDQTSEAGQMTSQKVYEDAASALQITDVPYGEQPEIGNKCTNSYVNCALDVVNGLTTSLKDKVASVQAIDMQSVTLILDNNVEVVFGNAEDIRDKERICLELLDRYPDQITYINVRSVENPTWRSI